MEVRCTRGDETWQAFEAAKNAQASRFLFTEPSDLPPGVILGAANGERMWQAVYAKFRELVPQGCGDGSSGSTAMYHADGRGCSMIVKRYRRNGTCSVWHVEAYDMSGPATRPDITVKVDGPWLDNDDAE